MALVEGKDYFVSVPDVHLRSGAGSGRKVNHLLLGDWLRYLGEKKSGWAKVRCRGDEGWLQISDFSEVRALEVNFIDIGQGDGCHIVTPDDEIVLIDAGVGSNMNRFLSWRYNLRRRNVERAPDFDPDDPDLKEPWLIHHVVISHPDNDHYYGLLDVFENPKLSFDKVYHNGIVERPDSAKEPGLIYPSKDDLGGYATVGSTRYVWDVVRTGKRMKEIIKAHPKTKKQYLSTMRACMENSPDVAFKSLLIDIDKLDTAVFLEPFDGAGALSLQILGPIAEKVERNNEIRKCLRKLGNEGVTKNGHSVILKLRYGKLSVLLGGDLNTQSQDFLLQRYTTVSTKSSSLERKIAKLQAKGDSIDANEQKTLDKARAKRALLITEARAIFECDVAKACHHGSAHFSDTFLKAINASATVISSGDNESHSHPRPDALGAFGKNGRGDRPLIFSTELARSTREFTSVIKYLNILQDYQRRQAEAASEKERKEIRQEMEARQDRNVAVYGMITLRALGDRLILAQKLEEPAANGAKWDIYELVYNSARETYEYTAH